MHYKYSQIKALKAIIKASLLAIVKNPGSIFFSLVFPLVFVWIFGSFGSSGFNKINISFSNNSDSNNAVYAILKNLPQIKINTYPNKEIQKQELEKGNLAAILDITKTSDSIHKQLYNIKLTSTNATSAELAQLVPILENISIKINPEIKNYIQIQKNIYSIRAYKQIDFILPGQIGFSILFSTLFGIAFTFYNLREQLVLKRFYASPVNKLNILIGIGFSRLFFQLLNVLVLILVGWLWLDFTLIHGFTTFSEMLLISFLMLMVLMGVGLIISSVVKTDATISLLINLFALPQMLLSGTFFPITVFPNWMQNICNIFPLTHFNTAMRKLSFEGLGIESIWQHIAVIGLWGFIIYVLVYKFFKWE